MGVAGVGVFVRVGGPAGVAVAGLLGIAATQRGIAAHTGGVVAVVVLVLALAGFSVIRAERRTRRAAAEIETTVAALVQRIEEAAVAMRAGAAELASATAGPAGAAAAGSFPTVQPAGDTIGGVVAVTRKVAAQANLLALNTSIEAARAGEVGQGFAMMASEVRELARLSSLATDEVARKAAAGDAEPARARRSATAAGQAARRVEELTADLAAGADRLRDQLAHLLSQLRSG